MSVSLDDLLQRAAQPPQRSRWTVPVVPYLWPASRWRNQVFGGVFLLLLFGGAFLLIPFLAATLILGPICGLCLASILNGWLVRRHSRRCTVLSVLVCVVLFTAAGFAVQPSLSYYLLSRISRQSGNVDRLRWVQQQLNEHPDDFRNGPARSTNEAALHDYYALPLHDLEPEQTGRRFMEKSFSGAFRRLLEDLASQGSPQVVVTLEEEVNLQEPPQTVLELLTWQKDPDFRRLAQDKRTSFRSKAVADLGLAYPEQDRSERVTALSQALEKLFQPRIPRACLAWVTDSKAAPGPHPRIEFAGRFADSGKFVKHSQTSAGGSANSPILLVIPDALWEVRLCDSRGNLLGQTQFDVNFPFKISRQGQNTYGNLGVYEMIHALVYEKTAWKLLRRIGLNAGPEPNTKP